MIWFTNSFLLFFMAFCSIASCLSGGNDKARPYAVGFFIILAIASTGQLIYGKLQRIENLISGNNEP